jgi:ABC-2 type transport system permease protein
MLRIITAFLITVFSFMVAQVVIEAQRTLYEAGDLDLLLSSPLPAKRLLAAKLIGLAGSSATTFAYLVLPIILPVAVIAQPRLLAVLPMLAALALVGASLGLGLSIMLVRLLGSRGARAAGQVLAAILSAMVFLIVQFTHQEGTPRGGMGGLLARMRESGLGADGWSALPARAVLGEPLSFLVVLIFALALFAATNLVFQRHFLHSYQSAGERSVRRVPTAASSRGISLKLFTGGLLRNIVRKEMRLLLREPELLFMIALRLIYLAPLILIATSVGDGPNSVAMPVLAAVGAVSAGQLAGSISWLTLSGEDAPDLLAVSPIDPRTVKRLKLVAALIIAMPIALILPLLIAPRDPVVALITFAGALVAGYCAGLVELLLGKPQRRSAFTKRQQGSFLVSLLGVLVTLVVGVVTAGVAYLV